MVGCEAPQHLSPPKKKKLCFLRSVRIKLLNSDFFMTTADLFPVLRELHRAEKLKVMQFLIAELAQEEEPRLQAGATYSLCSPLNSHEAANKLSQLLETN